MTPSAMNPNAPACGATGKRNGLPCKNAAMPNGRCRIHGGKSVPRDPESMKDNKQGVVTGELERIFFGNVTDKRELEIIEVARKATVVNLLTQEIQLITLREYRMQDRIEKLKKAGPFTVVSISTETGYGSQKRFKRSNLENKVQEGTLGQIQHIEEALTRVQAQKARLIQMKYEIEKDNKPVDLNSVERFMKSLNGAAANAWRDVATDPAEETGSVEGDEDQDA